MNKYLIILIILSACGGNKAGVSPSLAEMYNGLQTELGVNFKSFATFAEQASPDEDAIGYCAYYSNVIHISDAMRQKETWEIERVLLHELGHCDFGLKHEESGIMKGVGDIYTYDEYLVERTKLMDRFKLILKFAK